MNQIERRDAGLAYISDDSVFEEQKKCRQILQKLNFIDRSDFAGISEIVKELFGKSEGAFVNCDYGSHIEVGKNFFANYNCTLLDVAKIKIGDNCQMAPNVAIYTAGHPIHPVSRNSAYEYGKEVTIGDNVWLRGKTGVFPGQDRARWQHSCLPGCTHWKQCCHRCRKRCDKRYPRLVNCCWKSVQSNPQNHR